jgi:Rha family phage regulatory protein
MLYDLTIIKHNGGTYVDSREVAEAIGKAHRHLLRDIRWYCAVIEKITQPKVGRSDFFVQSSYFDKTGRELPCFLLSKMGCELVANKLIGERGIMFTAAYVKKFNEMESAERDAEIKSHARPRLGEFNTAVKNVLGGMYYALTKPKEVIKFLRGVYTPLGIEVQPNGDYSGYYTATGIARLAGVYSGAGNPHAHAVAAIISKQENYARHTIAIPYGLVGITLRYDRHILNAVRDWIAENRYPSVVPYNGFKYRVYYRQPAFSGEKEFL